MPNYAKIGNRQGKPAYRTQDSFKFRKYLKVQKVKSSAKTQKRSCYTNVHKHS